LHTQVLRKTKRPNPAELLKKSGKGGKILCWVMTHGGNHASKAMAIKKTWGAGCDVLLFMTTQTHADLPTVVLDIGRNESRATLWRKSIQAWLHVYATYLEEVDWFMRADDDVSV
jgi:glycoprotein-N-acetylgalactosamine 3-beta-galactosyltransferase